MLPFHVIIYAESRSAKLHPRRGLISFSRPTSSSRLRCVPRPPNLLGRLLASREKNLSSFSFHSPYTLPSSVSRKSCIWHSYENCWGVHQQFPFWIYPPNLQIERVFPTYPFSFHTLAHSFAPRKNSTLFFSINSALFCKNTRGVGMC